MASPYQTIKKFEKEIMVILTGVAMFCFVIMDPLTSNSSGGPGRNPFVLPAVLAAVGAGAAWIHGTVTKKSGTYWINGAVIGACMGTAFILFASRGEAGVSTSVGKIPYRDLMQMKSRRVTANRFIEQAILARELPEGQFRDFMLSRFFQQYRFGGVSNREIMMRHLLVHEATRLGIQVNDQSVIDYINEASDKKLDSAAFKKLRTQLGVSETELFNTIKDELRSRLAYQVLNPELVYLPEQFWQDYQKFNVRHTIAATAIPVDAFTKEIEPLTDGELKKFFDEFKSTFPTGDQPGFRQPDRKRLAYLTADVEAIEKAVGEPTEENLRSLYEERKEVWYKEAALPESSTKDKSPASKPAVETPAKTDGEKPNTDLKLPPPEKPEAKPADKKEEPKPAPVKDAKPETEKKAEAEKKAEPEKKPADDASCGAEDPAQPATPTEKPATEPKKDVAENEKTVIEPKKKDVAEVEATPDAAKKPTEKTDEKAEPAAKYKSFESVKDELRDAWLRDKTQAEAKLRLEVAIEQINALRRDRDAVATVNPDKALERKAIQDFAQKVKEVMVKSGKERGLVLAETELLTDPEFRADKDNPLATAREPFNFENIKDFRNIPQQATVADRVYGGSTISFVPEFAESVTGESQYVFWIFESVDEHVPEFDEPGIRQQVEKALRLKQARPRAEKRAAELAAAAASKIKDSSLAEALGEETVTGAKDSDKLKAIPTSPFSWLRQSRPGLQSNPFGGPQIEFGSILGIENIDADFMQAVAAMSVDDVKVIHNAKKDIYYIVQLVNRTPSGPEDASFATSQKQFLDEHMSMSTAYDRLAASQFMPVQQRWFDEFMTRFGVDLAALDQE